ncbi:helix-turn-helix domain-containing protein [Pleomorphomonas oryzae]|uniref:helix-turn-helix domain-containing protein n=1 Tax=Pleomorphomonas oryzae TaxID=261934 RepID=UPI0004273E36|nr:helix-turn-helix transcriptional regulator [Pleomorphomonas oryzae]
MTVKSPNPIDVHVGSRVRMRRFLVGMSQGKLAEQLGVTFQQVQKYEKGTSRISASRLQTIARVFEVPIGFFFENIANHSHVEDDLFLDAADASVLTQDGVALNKAFVRIKSAKVRRSIIDLVKMLADDDRTSMTDFSIDADLRGLRSN